MLYKHFLFTTALLMSGASFANIPIESHGLSQQNPQMMTPRATHTGVETVTTNMNWQLIQKNQQLETELRTLRGKIEELENANDKLNHELNNRYTDLDQRLELLQEKLDTNENQDLPQEATPDNTEDNQQDTPPSLITPIAPEPLTPAPLITQNNYDNELDRAAYTIALEAYKQGGAKKAMDPMRNFIKNHPNSIYVSNAYFWMGEFYLAIEPVNYKRAQANYAEVVNRFPQSAKAATAVYRLYSMAKNVDQNMPLANQYANMLQKNYPNSEETGFLK
ncbi:YbgF trimerization domain-containing protein [uncultured Acinetobacter sp.]|uniref:YbgF trimerization domain-containing protein n=1 Tax=uncultured Acinetobacter sp. TaxID=165433 RepID=UPI0026300D8D|nr:YbgF trimerization domain-containing protein [uncultured Acinetobacter sp.]